MTRPEPHELAAAAVSFRARKKLAAVKRNAAISSAVLAIEFNQWLERHFDLPQSAVPTLAGMSPEAAAGVVRAQWGVDLRPVRNVVHLLESRGVRVFALDIDHVEVDAFSFWHGRRPFVFLNTLTSGERGRFDAAHELGHLVLHSGCHELSSQHAEDEANQFASAFLMPRTSVLSRMPFGALTSDIIEGKTIWNVSAMALAHRLHDLGMLTDDQYRSACVALARSGYRSTEPDGVGREASQLLTKVLRSLRAQRITLADVSAELCISLEDLGSLLLGLTITGVAASGIERGHRTGSAAGRPRLSPVTPS
ncbi:ImmA/IrrE family metallo-endopeptidase [Saccharopolyspora antimicrobica]|uniref:ImmA/IrrE family metallo-endopeptidase n=1 Tax=Saccharopolyspora antimicrobica TaxID=455193 RepID=UPI001FEB9AD5|nr:ImmA/IrrE family metallo-endopeptidase [Saccharopolyspora antimicrobica]